MGPIILAIDNEGHRFVFPLEHVFITRKDNIVQVERAVFHVMGNHFVASQVWITDNLSSVVNFIAGSDPEELGVYYVKQAIENMPEKGDK